MENSIEKEAEIVKCKFLEEFIEMPRVDIQVPDLYNILFLKTPNKGILSTFL